MRNRPWQCRRCSKPSPATRTHTSASRRWSCCPDSTTPGSATPWSRRSTIGTTGCVQWPTAGSSTIPIRDGAAAAGRAGQGGIRVRAAGADAGARGDGTDPKVREMMTGLVMSGQDLFRAVVIEALGEYGAAYALQPIMDVARIEGPCRTTRCWRSGGSATSAARCACGPAAQRAPQSPALHRRGDLPAWQQLRVAPRLPDGDAPVRDRESRLSGALARCGGRISPRLALRVIRRRRRRSSNAAARPAIGAAAIALALGPWRCETLP